MPRVHHVKKARKAKRNAGIKKGDQYWWAGYRLGRSSFKRYWKHPPRPSEVTASDYCASVYSIQEEMEDAKPSDSDDLQSLCEEWQERIEEIAQECRDKFDNMPDGLQQGDTGQLLEERADSMDAWADEVGSVDCNYSADDGDIQSFDEFAAEAIEQMRSACPE